MHAYIGSGRYVRLKIRENVTKKRLVTEEVERLIKELDIKLSGFINEALPIWFSPIKHIRKEIHDQNGKIQELKDTLKRLEKERGNASGITREMIATLMEMHLILEENPNYFPGMLKGFRNEFSPSASQNKFRKTLRTYGNDEGLTREEPQVFMSYSTRRWIW